MSVSYSFPEPGSYHFTRMRLLVINWFDWTHPLWGGAEVYLHEVFRRLAARGHEVTLLCSPYAGGAADETIDGIRILRRGGFWTFHLQVPRVYRRELAAERWDCVFEYTNKVPMLTPLFVRAPLVAVALHLFGTSIFHESKLPIAAYIYAMERLLPLIYRRLPWIAISASTRDELAALGIPAEHIHLAYQGIDLQWFQPPPSNAASADNGDETRTNAAGDALTIAWVGRMKRYKRADVLLRAMPAVLAQLPGARLELAGDGPEAPRLKRLAVQLDLPPDRVRFAGLVSEEEKRALLRRAAVLVQPSLKEGWGRTVLEAGACGVPAIVSDVPGLRESVVPGQTGVLVRPGTPDAFGAALVDFLRDTPRRAAMGAAARTFAAQFSWDAAVDATEQAARSAYRRHTGEAGALTTAPDPSIHLGS